MQVRGPTAQEPAFRHIDDKCPPGEISTAKTRCCWHLARVMHARCTRMTRAHTHRRMGHAWGAPIRVPWKLVVDRTGQQEECSPCQQHRRTAQRESRPSRGRPKRPGIEGVDTQDPGPARLGPARRRVAARRPGEPTTVHPRSSLRASGDHAAGRDRERAKASR